MGKVRRFEVQFDGEYPVINSGQVLRGHILLNLTDSTKVQCIKLHLLGRGKVHWSKKKGKERVHYRAEEIYFNDVMLLFGDCRGDAQQHPAGNHRIPFAFEIPSECPSSYEDQYGYIRYNCKAIMDRPWKFNHETKAGFTVIKPLDLNSIPGVAEPLQGHETQEVSCCCCVSGDVEAQFTLGKQGYVPGENIHIQAEIHNRSNTETNGSSCTLLQHVSFLGVSDRFFSSGHPKPKDITHKLVTVKHEGIPAGQSDYWTGNALMLRVPPVPASELQGCSIIELTYQVLFRVSVQYGEDIVIGSKIIVGTIPLAETIQRPSAPALPAAEPTAPDLEYLMEPAPPYEPPPPSYEECISGRVDIRDETDSSYVMGDTSFAPIYPVYNYNTQYNNPSAPTYGVPDGQDITRI